MMMIFSLDGDQRVLGRELKKYIRYDINKFDTI